MTHALTSITVAIGDLVSHPANVRINAPETYETDNIAHLKAGIAELGLIQPLLVQEVDGTFGVLAGGRRHAALKELVNDKAAKGFTKKTKIDCRLVPKDCDVTTAMSLAENITQEPMNAIDEYEAFARMMEVDKQTPETIAKMFGTTVAAVKGRLRFGLIHPDIRAAARAKSITLDVMKAFADHPNKDVQKDVFDAVVDPESYTSAYLVKQAFNKRGTKVSDAIGQLVQEDYKSRGGEVTADLLEEHSILEDKTLVDEILAEHLLIAAEAKRTELGMSWADTMLEHDHGALAEFDRIYPGPIEPDEAGLKRLAHIDARLEAVCAEMEDEELDDDAYHLLDKEVDALEEEARDLQEAYAQDDLDRAGVIASWNGHQIQLTIGLVRAEDAPVSADTDANTASSDAAQPSDAIIYSNALEQDVQQERAVALSAALARNPKTAMDLAHFKLITDALGGMPITYAFEWKAGYQFHRHVDSEDVDQTATRQLAEVKSTLNLSWHDENTAASAQFEGFRGLKPKEKEQLVAWALARTTLPCLARNAQRDSLMYAIEAEIMPDIRAHWTPNAAFFDRLKKAWLLGILNKDLGLAQEAVSLAGESKKKIVAFMDKLFAEPFATLTDEQRAAVAAWCPPNMQTTLPAIEETGDITNAAPEQIAA